MIPYPHVAGKEEEDPSSVAPLLRSPWDRSLALFFEAPGPGMKGQFCDRERVLQELFRSLEGLRRGHTCYLAPRGPRKGGKTGLFRPFVVPPG